MFLWDERGSQKDTVSVGTVGMFHGEFRLNDRGVPVKNQLPLSGLWQKADAETSHGRKISLLVLLLMVDSY